MSTCSDLPPVDQLPRSGVQGGSRFGQGTIMQALTRWWIILLFGILGYAAALYYMSVTPPNLEAVAVMEAGQATEGTKGHKTKDVFGFFSSL